MHAVEESSRFNTGIRNFEQSLWLAFEFQRFLPSRAFPTKLSSSHSRMVTEFIIIWTRVEDKSRRVERTYPYSIPHNISTARPIKGDTGYFGLMHP